ncbi:acyltransferase [Mesorhizobium sp. B2-5-9]|uniref:acyltransferase family protein n=1 Tax=Mesorhizobium sp. B2-5-9 TaxID=2589921 RepID=UPI00112DE956|nr:acyltransferase [Mesorhizobium sp. B2-5-9]TPJ99505.1 acyltransferase [Mesorhizobium sp. B2-5-9]
MKTEEGDQMGGRRHLAALTSRRFFPPRKNAVATPKSQYNLALDGLRAIAALLVLADHAHLINFTYGNDAVWMFFVLSAYLLTRPFVEGTGVYRLPALATYILRRLLRLLPMYAVYVLIYAFSIGNSEFAYSHLILFQGRGHLWTINQEIVFYILLPFIVLPMKANAKKRIPIAISLLILAWMADHYAKSDVFSLPAIESRAPFFAAPFLVGMAGAFMAKWWHEKTIALSATTTQVINVVAVVGCISAIYWAASIQEATGYNPVWEQPLPFAVLFAGCIVWIDVAPRSWMYSALSWAPLRSLGRAGYSFYLLHWLVIEYLKGMAPMMVFVIGGFITYVISQITYRAVEIPCMEFGRKITSAIKARDRGITSISR